MDLRSDPGAEPSSERQPQPTGGRNRYRWANGTLTVSPRRVDFTLGNRGDGSNTQDEYDWIGPKRFDRLRAIARFARPTWLDDWIRSLRLRVLYRRRWLISFQDTIVVLIYLSRSYRSC